MGSLSLSLGQQPCSRQSGISERTKPLCILELRQIQKSTPVLITDLDSLATCFHFDLELLELVSNQYLLLQYVRVETIYIETQSFSFRVQMRMTLQFAMPLPVSPRWAVPLS